MKPMEFVLDRDNPAPWGGGGDGGGGGAERHGASAHSIRRATPPAPRNGLGAALGHGDSGADTVLGGLNVAESE